VNYFVAPNAFVIAHPDHTVVVRVMPEGPAACRAQWTMLVPSVTAGRDWDEHWRRARESHEATFAEDVALAEGVQSVLETQALPCVRFGRNEVGPIAFHESLARLLGTP